MKSWHILDRLSGLRIRYSGTIQQVVDYLWELNTNGTIPDQFIIVD